MDDEVAFFVIGLVQVLVWVDLENVVRHLETDWLHLLGNVIAILSNMAESLIRGAVKFWKCSVPFSSNFLEHIRWDGKLGATGINDGWVGGILTWLLHWSGSIVHTLSFKSPGSEPIWEILECFEAVSSSNNLGRVISSEESIWSFVHFF